MQPRLDCRSGTGLAVLAAGLWLTIADVHAQSPGDLAAREEAAGASAVHSAPPASLAGWSAFEIKKTDAEMTETARLADLPKRATRTQPGDVQLPPQEDVLRLSTGIGYLQGAD